MTETGKTTDPIYDLWQAEFRGPTTGVWKGAHCGLCGNYGVIDTRGKVFTPAGVECGVRAYCICPNGRAMRERVGK